jgi:hypothetical protein
MNNIPAISAFFLGSAFATASPWTKEIGDIEQEFPALYAKYGALWKEGMHRAGLFDAGLEGTESFSAGGQRYRR